MEKAGKSKDAQQQLLRDHKKRWNFAYKEFSQRLKAFKDALNGRGSSRYGLPPSDIKNPLPPEIISFITELSSNYQSLAEEASKISQEQEHYSQSRKKPTEAKMASTIKIASTTKQPEILIGDKILPTKLAITAEEQEQGLMYVKEPTIMSFVYSQPSNTRFWMKNTPRELDIVFSINGKITNICRGEPYSTKLVGSWDSLSDLVVELPYGSCEKLGVSVGDTLKLV